MADDSSGASGILAGLLVHLSLRRWCFVFGDRFGLRSAKPVEVNVEAPAAPAVGAGLS